ncbi:MAG: hypothetical protein ABL989_03670 [Gammaproteobacteria bacterium]
MVLRQLSGLWRCAWPAPVAAFLGATMDEWHHAGFTTWMTLCQTSAPTPWRAVSLQVELMPAMATGLLAVMVWQWLRVWLSGVHRPAMLLACQASCLLVMVFAGGLCAGLASAIDARAGRLLVMGIVDLAASLSLAGALVLGSLAVHQRWSRSDAVLHIQQHRR